MHSAHLKLYVLNSFTFVHFWGTFLSCCGWWINFRIFHSHCNLLLALPKKQSAGRSVSVSRRHERVGILVRESSRVYMRVGVWVSGRERVRERKNFLLFTFRFGNLFGVWFNLSDKQNEKKQSLWIFFPAFDVKNSLFKCDERFFSYNYQLVFKTILTVCFLPKL